MPNDKLEGHKSKRFGGGALPGLAEDCVMLARIGVRVRFICCLSANFTSGNGLTRGGEGECIKHEGTQGESPPL